MVRDGSLPPPGPRRPAHVARGFPTNALRLIIGLMAAIALGGCWYQPHRGGPAANVPDEVGLLHLAVEMAAPYTGGERLHLAMRQAGLLLEHTLPIEGGRWEEVLEGVYAGRWDVTLEVWDGEGFLTHRGQAQVEVLADEVADLHVALTPLPGQLYVEADLAGFRDRHQVGRARLNQQPGDGRHDSIREEGEDTIRWQRELPPGTYDLQVALYGESFHAHRLVYAGPWFQVDILPGREVAVSWRPATGEVRFHGSVGALPPAPQGVAAWLEGDEVVLEWTTVAANAVETAIWWSRSPFDQPEILATLPASGASGLPEQFRHRPLDAGAVPGSRLTYGVSSIDAAGRHSLRTHAPPLTFRPDPQPGPQPDPD